MCRSGCGPVLANMMDGWGFQKVPQKPPLPALHTQPQLALFWALALLSPLPLPLRQQAVGRAHLALLGVRHWWKSKVEAVFLRPWQGRGPSLVTNLRTS